MVHEIEARLEEEERKLPSRGLFSTYDSVRRRIAKAIDKRGGRLGRTTVEALLLVPDVFMLLVRLVLDREVPQGARAVLGGALAYFVLPMDFLPEALLGGAGYLDDLVLALAILSQVFDEELEPYVERHWSGSKEVRQVIRDVLGSAQKILGTTVYGKLQKLLLKRGIDLGKLANEKVEEA